jgi:hypothetical protein
MSATALVVSVLAAAGTVGNTCLLLLLWRRFKRTPVIWVADSRGLPPKARIAPETGR